MKIDDLKSWVETAGSVLKTFKALKELMPAGPKRDDAERLIERAERELKLADASAARELGYFLCRRHFPPGNYARRRKRF